MFLALRLLVVCLGLPMVPASRKDVMVDTEEAYRDVEEPRGGAQAEGHAEQQRAGGASPVAAQSSQVAAPHGHRRQASPRARMLMVAHRGASAYTPENTLLSQGTAIEWGADGTEFDVHLTKDGEVVVLHDETLERTWRDVPSNAHKVHIDADLNRILTTRIADMNFAEFGRVELGVVPHKPPAIIEEYLASKGPQYSVTVYTLEDAMDLALKNDKFAFVELKRGQNPAEMAAAIEKIVQTLESKYSLADIKKNMIFISFDDAVLFQLRDMLERSKGEGFKFLFIVCSTKRGCSTPWTEEQAVLIAAGFATPEQIRADTTAYDGVIAKYRQGKYGGEPQRKALTGVDFEMDMTKVTKRIVDFAHELGLEEVAVWAWKKTQVLEQFNGENAGDNPMVAERMHQIGVKYFTSNLPLSILVAYFPKVAQKIAIQEATREFASYWGAWKDTWRGVVAETSQHDTYNILGEAVQQSLLDRDPPGGWKWDSAYAPE